MMIGIIITLILMIIACIALVRIIVAICYKLKLKGRKQIQRDEVEKTKIQDL